MELIVKMKFGSQLYGTDTPESDIDIKGVFMPDKREILLGNIPKSINITTNKSNIKNKKEDVDTVLYSLHYFINLACQGQTCAIDMLHAPDNMLIQSSDLWEHLRKEKKKFYTKNMQAFIGYARSQANKYGVKGSRLKDAKKVIDFLESKSSVGDGFCPIKLKDMWEKLPEGEHIKKEYDEKIKMNFYVICGKKINETAYVNYALNIVDSFYNRYGKRAKLAEKNEGIDWKAVSHSLRVAYQLREILATNDLKFPLRQAEYLRKVKVGRLNYIKEVGPVLDSLVDHIEVKIEQSVLPEKVDRNYWDDFIYNAVQEWIEG